MCAYLVTVIDKMDNHYVGGFKLKNIGINTGSWFQYSLVSNYYWYLNGYSGNLAHNGVKFW